MYVLKIIIIIFVYKMQENPDAWTFDDYGLKMTRKEKITAQEVEKYNALAISLFKKYEIYRGNNEKPLKNVILGVAALITNLGLVPIGNDKKKMIDITSKLNTFDRFAITTVICDFKLGQLNKDIKPHVFHARLNQKDEKEYMNIKRNANKWAWLKSDCVIENLLTNSDFENLEKLLMRKNFENMGGKILIKTKSRFIAYWHQPFEIWEYEPDSKKMLDFNGNSIKFMRSEEFRVSLSDYEGGTNTLILKIPYSWEQGSMIIYMPKYNAEREDFIRFMKKLEVDGEFDKFLKSFAKYGIPKNIEMPEFLINCDNVDLNNFLNEAIGKIYYSKIFEQKTSFEGVYHRIESSIGCTPLGIEADDSYLYSSERLGITTELIRVNKPFLFFVLDASNCIFDVGMFVGTE